MDGLLEEIPSSLLSEWEQYYLEEPFGQIRQDYLSGMLIQFVYNALRGEDSDPLTLQEILYPKYVSEPAHQEQVDADLAFIDSLVATGKVVDIRSKRK